MIEQKIPVDEMDEKQRKLFRTSVFLVKLLMAGAVFQALLFFYPSTIGIQSWFAGFISGILDILGVQAFANTHYIVLNTGLYRITQDCLGWKSVAAFTGLMFASGSLWEHHRFLIGGIGVILAANVVRVLTTVYLSHTGVITFEIIHGTLWRWGLSAVVLTLWFYWFRRERYKLF